MGATTGERKIFGAGPDAFAAASLGHVADAGRVRFVALLHGRVPVVLDGIIRPDGAHKAGNQSKDRPKQPMGTSPPTPLDRHSVL